MSFDIFVNTHVSANLPVNHIQLIFFHSAAYSGSFCLYILFVYNCFVDKRFREKRKEKSKKSLSLHTECST